MDGMSFELMLLLWFFDASPEELRAAVLLLAVGYKIRFELDANGKPQAVFYKP